MNRPPFRQGTLALLFSPPMVAGLLCCTIVAIFAAVILRQTHGTFAYPLDDSYIHLALARTLAFQHTWGFTPGEFASASSSPGWTLLLAAADLLFGSHLLTPIVLNLLLVFAIFYAADAGFRRFAPEAPLWTRYLSFAAIVLFTPLPSLVLIGMEHVAQTLTVLLMVLFATEILVRPRASRLPIAPVAGLLAASAAAGAIRYEAVFAVLPIAILLVVRQRFLVTVLFGICAALGPALFGLYSHHLSGFWLPFSVLSKAAQNATGSHEFLVRFLMLLRGHTYLPLLWTLLPLWLLRLRARGFWDATQLVLLLTLGLSATHALASPAGWWLMRYESYFVCLNLFAMALAFSTVQPPLAPSRRFLELPLWGRCAFVVLLLGLAMLGRTLLFRMSSGLTAPVQAAVDRFHEHLQIARFVHDHYDHDTVVLNDIGAVAFLSDAHMLDLAGLGSAEPLLVRRATGTFTREDMAHWAAANHAAIAILQPGWPYVRDLTPSTWTLVQTWHMPRNVVFGDSHEVSFYAVTLDGVPRLCNALATFDKPPDDTLAVNRCPTP